MSWEWRGVCCVRTSCDFLDVVEDEVHELIVAFECAGDCSLAMSALLLCFASNPCVECALVVCDVLAKLHLSLSLVHRAQSNSPSLPPLNLTWISLSMYLFRSRIFSFLGRGVSESLLLCDELLLLAPPRLPPLPPRFPPLFPPLLPPLN